MRRNLPVDATSKDGNESSRDRESKKSEIPALPDPQRLRVRVSTSHVLPHPQPVIHSEPTKKSQHDDLKANTGDDGVVAAVEELLVVLAGCCGDAAADGLHDQAGQVGGEEDAREPLRLDARERGVEREGDVLEREVDGDADESWPEDDGANLQLKGVLVPGVVVEEDATNVSWTCFVRLIL